MHRLLCLTLLGTAPVFWFSCGDDAEESADALEQACEDYCQAALGLECGELPITVEQCQSQCGALADQLLGVCVQETADTYRCAADGGFECVNEIPVPKSACTSEATALAECSQDAGCKRFCSVAESEGCGAGCLDACIAKRDGLSTDETSCGFQYDGLVDCAARLGVTCNGGTPTTASCPDQALSVGDCLAEEGDACAGWCWAAEELGCGDGCLDDCATRLADPTCGSSYATMLDCGMFFGDALCQGGGLTVFDICASDLTNYQACVDGQ